MASPVVSVDPVAKKKTTSTVWTYFGFKAGTDGNPLDETVAVCRLCYKNISAKGSNTSNLFSHLKTRHPREFADLKAMERPSTSKKDQQPTLRESIQHGEKYGRSSKRWEQLTNSVARAIAKDMMPLAIVERPGFKTMLSVFDERYELPSRSYISKTAIPALYNSTKEKLEQEIKEDFEFFSATTDLWSSVGMVPYISYTVHYITKSWELKSRCLQTSFIPQDHTGENIAEALSTILEAWGLDQNQQVCLTTDNGANIIRATEVLHWQQLSCFGHNLNLAVTNLIKNDTRVSRALGLARKIISAFSTSWKKRRELKKVQVEKALPEHSLIADCPTRWESMQFMVSRLLEQEVAVRIVLSSDRKTTHLVPTWQDIEVLESLLIPKHFLLWQNLPTFFHGEKHVTISSIIPVLHNLSTKILVEQEDDTDLTKSIKKKIIESLKSRYVDSRVTELHTGRNIFGPSFKMDYAESDEDKQKLITLVQNKAVETMCVLELFASSNEEVAEGTEPVAAEQGSPSKKRRLLTTFLQKSPVSVTDSQEACSSHSPQEKVEKEIQAYLHSPKLDIKSKASVLDWWKENAAKFYSTLSTLARKFHCICATSCPSERLFSASGNVVTAARASLRPDKVNMLVFLAVNIE